MDVGDMVDGFVLRRVPRKRVRVGLWLLKEGILLP